MGSLFTLAVGKGIELLHIAQRVLGLAFHPGTQARLQRAVHHLERARWQRLPALRRQHTGCALADRHKDGHQFSMQSLGRSGVQLRR